MGAVPKHHPLPRPPAFDLRRSANGNWIVEGPGNRCGGIFIDEAARHFIHEEARAADTGRSSEAALCLLRTSPTPYRGTP